MNSHTTTPGGLQQALHSADRLKRDLIELVHSGCMDEDQEQHALGVILAIIELDKASSE
jgi:hypothetical protein